MLKVVNLGLTPYVEVERAMLTFTAQRTSQTPDELWLVQHPAVFTQGIGGRAEHVLAPGGVPVLQTQRGGQVTFHGPGQVVAYPLVDLKRLGFYVKEFVYRLEQSVMSTLAQWQITGHRVEKAPGVYVRMADPYGHARLQPTEAQSFVGLGKIAALGIKVTRHCAWHGVALNVSMDLEPFSRINPCGYAGLKATDMRSLGADAQPEQVSACWAQHLSRLLSPSASAP